MADLADVRALVFDMDQTLIDFAASREAGLRATLDLLEASGHTVPGEVFLRRHSQIAAQEDAAYLAAGTWRPTVERFRILCREFSLPSDGLADLLTARYTEARYANLRQYPETAPTLAKLKGRLPLFLVTNGPSAHQHREIEVTGVAPYFDLLFVCDDFGLRKPDPRVFEMIRREAGFEAHEMLIAGDNPDADIDEPRRQGWRTVWVVRDEPSRNKADPSRADAVVATVAELPALLGLDD